jgi:hypothetical protein
VAGVEGRGPAGAGPVVRDLAARVRPAVAAGARALRVTGPLAGLVPGGGIRRGATVAVDGPPGTGVTTAALALAAAATAAGEWAAVVDPPGTLGALAAAAAGVDLERCAVVRRVPADRWPTVVAALLDGVALVAASVPPRLRPGDARRLVARARERAAVLVVTGPWPVEAAVRLHTEAGAWARTASGLLHTRDLHARVEVHGTPAPVRLHAAAG